MNNFSEDLLAIANRRNKSCASAQWLEKARRFLATLSTPSIALDDVARWLHEVYVFGIQGDTPLPIVVHEYLKAYKTTRELANEQYQIFLKTGNTSHELGNRLHAAKEAEAKRLNELESAWSTEGVVIENEVDRLRNVVAGLLEALPKCDECKAPATWTGNVPMSGCSEEEPEPYWCDAHLPADREAYVSITDRDPNRDPLDIFRLYKFELKHAATIRMLAK